MHRSSPASSWRQAALQSAIAVLLSVAPAAQAQHFPTIPLGEEEVRLEIIADGLAGGIGPDFQLSPTDIVPDGTGRLFVATLGGVVRVIDFAGRLLAEPFLTSSQTESSVPETGEWGMTSIVFHPDFAEPAAAGFGAFYTICTVFPGDGIGTVDFGIDPGNHRDVLKEWKLADIGRNRWDDTLGDEVRIVLQISQPGQAHNMVDLAFGPDELLYISLGDGGALPSESRDRTSIYGNILRIDPFGSSSANGAYGIPSDNPGLVDGDPATHAEIWASGFRSPFRMNFDRSTGDLWLGDVGQSDVEEIDRVEANGDYGWNWKEGSLRSGQAGPGCCRVKKDTPSRNGGQTLTDEYGLTDPVFEYDHDEGLSVIGGFVYRGSALPGLVGQYVFAELGENLPSARLFYGDPDTGTLSELRIDPDGDYFDAEGALLPLRIISVGEDEDGELLLATVGIDPRQGGGIDGLVVRLVPEPSALPSAMAALMTVLAIRCRRTLWRRTLGSWSPVAV